MMTVSDILNRALQIEWFEAVALVRATIERVTASAAVSQLPELHQIVLHPSGEVVVTGTSRTDDPVQAAATIIQTLISQSEPPVQLRLLIAQATAPVGQTYDSLRAFDDALAFFERPGRTTILQELYARASAASPRVQPAPAAVTTAAAEPKKKKEIRSATPSNNRRNALTVAAGVVLVLGAAATIGLLRAGASATGGEGSTLGRAAKGVGQVVAGVASSISKGVGLRGENAPKPVEKAAEPAPVNVAKPAKRERRATPPVQPATPLERITVRAFDLSANIVPVRQPVSGSAPGPEPAPADDTVYSADAKDVTAPVARRPQLPRELPTGVLAADLSKIEVIVLPDGTVESVKLLSGPKNVHHAMFLSAVKAWEFRPAMRNGVPVKYRKTVWLAR